MTTVILVFVMIQVQITPVEDVNKQIVQEMIYVIKMEQENVMLVLMMMIVLELEWKFVMKLPKLVDNVIQMLQNNNVLILSSVNLINH